MDGLTNIDDASKCVIALISELGLAKYAYFENDSVVLENKDESKIISIYSVDGTTLNVYLINGPTPDPLDADVVDIEECTEIDLHDPQSINILKEWIGKLDINGHSRRLTGPSV